jgi:hypothetical protein
MKDILAIRLYNQQISQTTFKKPDGLLSHLIAVQGQDYLGAKWSVGLRLPPGSTDTNIEQALLGRTIIRTWAMRGTLHLIAASDIRWILALLSPRIIAGNARRYKELELDEKTLARSNKLLTKALQNNKQLTRTALLDILQQNGISTKGQRAPYMLQRASYDQLICQGVMRGRDPIYFSMDSLPKSKMMEWDEALSELTKRYFMSRGPATLQDFVWWSGLSTTDAKKGLETVKSQLVHENIDGQIYWHALSSMPSEKSQNTYLLPGFDEYLLSYKDRSLIMDIEYMKTLTPTNGMLSPTIVMNGKVIGTWKRTFKKGSVIIELNPFITLTATENKAIAATAKRYGEYLGMDVTIL